MRDGTATPRWTEWPSREFVPCEKCQDENLMCDESCAPLPASGLTPLPKDKPETLADEAANQRFTGSGQTQARAETVHCYRCGRRGTRGFVFTGKAGLGAYTDPQQQASCAHRRACERRQRVAERKQGWT